jgi:hypothetical protein
MHERRSIAAFVVGRHPAWGGPIQNHGHAKMKPVGQLAIS